MWAVLRNRGLDGYKFRFQQRLGPYFGDFICQSERLVVEVDGDTHYTQAGTAMPAGMPIWRKKDIGLCGSPTTK